MDLGTIVTIALGIVLACVILFVVVPALIAAVGVAVLAVLAGLVAVLAPIFDWVERQQWLPTLRTVQATLVEAGSIVIAPLALLIVTMIVVGISGIPRWLDDVYSYSPSVLFILWIGYSIYMRGAGTIAKRIFPSLRETGSRSDRQEDLPEPTEEGLRLAPGDKVETVSADELNYLGRAVQRVLLNGDKYMITTNRLWEEMDEATRLHFQEFLIETHDPLASEPGPAKRRFRIWVYRMATFHDESVELHKEPSKLGYEAP